MYASAWGMRLVKMKIEMLISVKKKELFTRVRNDTESVGKSKIFPCRVRNGLRCEIIMIICESYFMYINLKVNIICDLVL